MKKADISNTADIIDSLDIIERIEELASMREDLVSEAEDDTNAEIEEAKQALLDFDENEGKELKVLQALAEEAEANNEKPGGSGHGGGRRNSPSTVSRRDSASEGHFAVTSSSGSSTTNRTTRTAPSPPRSEAFPSSPAPGRFPSMNAWRWGGLTGTSRPTHGCSSGSRTISTTG